MKKLYLLLLLVCSLPLLITGCKEDNAQEAVTVNTLSLKNVSYTSAEMIVSVEGSAGERGVCWSDSDIPTVNDSKLKAGSGSGTFTAEITGLSEGTYYMLRPYAMEGNKSVVYGEPRAFRTYEKGQALASITEIPEIDMYTATVTAFLVSDGGSEISEFGLCYGLDDEPTVADSKIVSGKTDIGYFDFKLTDLTDLALYYVRPYVINDSGTFYGMTYELYTLDDVPTPQIPEITTFDDTSITVSAAITMPVEREVTEWGICWGDKSNPGTTNKIVCGSSSGETQTKTITGLTMFTVYYIRTYAITGNGTYYSGQVSEMTIGETPVVSTGAPKANSTFKYNFTIADGQIVSLGKHAETPSAIGYCYSDTNTEPTIADNIVTQTNLAVGTMQDVLIDMLAVGRKYYVRAFGTNSYGTAYGEVIEVQTKPEYFKLASTDAGTGPGNPFYNALRCYYLPTADGGSATPTTGIGPWQKEKYDAMHAAFQKNGSRKFDYHFLVFTSNNAAPPEIGTENYVLIRFCYANSANTKYIAQVNFKVTIDEDGYFTFHDKGLTNSNYDGQNGNQYVGAEFASFLEYYQSGKFKVEFESGTVNESSTNNYLVYPVNDTDKYQKFSALSYNSVAYLAPW